MGRIWCTMLGGDVAIARRFVKGQTVSRLPSRVGKKGAFVIKRILVKSAYVSRYFGSYFDALGTSYASICRDLWRVEPSIGRETSLPCTDRPTQRSLKRHSRNIGRSDWNFPSSVLTLRFCHPRTGIMLWPSTLCLSCHRVIYRSNVTVDANVDRSQPPQTQTIKGMTRSERRNRQRLKRARFTPVTSPLQLYVGKYN